MTNIEMEMIKAESVEHSNNLSDWSNEALIKEFCWNASDAIKNSKDLFNNRLKGTTIELINRIKQNCNYDIELFYSNLNLLVQLFYHQKEMCEAICASSINRNNTLRKIEDILKIRTIIPDILLP